MKESGCYAVSIKLHGEVFFLRSWQFLSWGTQWGGWLRHCVTSREVAGSIPDGDIGIFRWHNPSGRTVALGSTQSLIEMVPRIFPRGKDGRFIRLTNLAASCADCLEIWETQPPGNFRVCPGLYKDCLPLFFCLSSPLASQGFTSLYGNIRFILGFTKPRRILYFDRSHPVVLYQYNSILVTYYHIPRNALIISFII
jgi:hypothetical protein